MKKYVMEVNNSIGMNNKKLFVGNLGAEISEAELREQFSYFGRVQFIKVIEDKGIAFVRMARPIEAYQARLGLNGVEINGRRIRVVEAKSRKEFGHYN